MQLPNNLSPSGFYKDKSEIEKNLKEQKNTGFLNKISKLIECISHCFKLISINSKRRNEAKNLIKKIWHLKDVDKTKCVQLSSTPFKASINICTSEQLAEHVNKTQSRSTDTENVFEFQYEISLLMLYFPNNPNFDILNKHENIISKYCEFYPQDENCLQREILKKIEVCCQDFSKLNFSNWDDFQQNFTQLQKELQPSISRVKKEIEFSQYIQKYNQYCKYCTFLKTHKEILPPLSLDQENIISKYCKFYPQDEQETLKKIEACSKDFSKLEFSKWGDFQENFTRLQNELQQSIGKNKIETKFSDLEYIQKYNRYCEYCTFLNTHKEMLTQEMLLPLHVDEENISNNIKSFISLVSAITNCTLLTIQNPIDIQALIRNYHILCKKLNSWIVKDKITKEPLLLKILQTSFSVLLEKDFSKLNNNDRKIAETIQDYCTLSKLINKYTLITQSIQSVRSLESLQKSVDSVKELGYNSFSEFNDGYIKLGKEVSELLEPQSNFLMTTVAKDFSVPLEKGNKINYFIKHQKCFLNAYVLCFVEFDKRSESKLKNVRDVLDKFNKLNFCNLQDFNDSYQVEQNKIHDILNYDSVLMQKLQMNFGALDEIKIHLEKYEAYYEEIGNNGRFFGIQLDSSIKNKSEKLNKCVEAIRQERMGSFNEFRNTFEKLQQDLQGIAPKKLLEQKPKIDLYCKYVEYISEYAEYLNKGSKVDVHLYYNLKKLQPCINKLQFLTIKDFDNFIKVFKDKEQKIQDLIHTDIDIKNTKMMQLVDDYLSDYEIIQAYPDVFDMQNVDSGIFSHLKQQLPKISPIPVGITNIGNTCYMNSGLQVLLLQPSVSEVLYNDDHNELSARKHLEENNLPKLIEDLAGLTLKKELRDFHSIYTSYHVQSAQLDSTKKADAQKEIEKAIIQLQNAIVASKLHPEFSSKTKRSQLDNADILSLILSILDVKIPIAYKNVTINTDTGVSSTSTSDAAPYKVLSMPLDAQADANAPQTLQNVVENFFSKEELINQSQNGPTDQPVITKTFRQPYIEGAPPKMLVIQLLRHQWNVDGSKINKKISFSVDDTVSFQKAVADQGVAANYRIKGFTIHHGDSLNGGHFTAYVRKEGQPQKKETSDDSWYYINDAYVEQKAQNGHEQAYCMVLELVDPEEKI
jgi:ubiquitin C-terminal hydrolase